MSRNSQLLPAARAPRVGTQQQRVVCRAKSWRERTPYNPQPGGWAALRYLTVEQLFSGRAHPARGCHTQPQARTVHLHRVSVWFKVFKTVLICCQRFSSKILHNVCISDLSRGQKVGQNSEPTPTQSCGGTGPGLSASLRMSHTHWPAQLTQLLPWILQALEPTTC